MEEKKDVGPSKVPSKVLEYRVKNLRSNIVEIVTPSGEVRIAPFDTVSISKAIAESAHTTELVGQNVIKLTIN